MNMDRHEFICQFILARARQVNTDKFKDAGLYVETASKLYEAIREECINKGGE